MAITGGRDCLPRPGGENRARCLTTTQPRKWRSSQTAIAVTNCVAETAPTPSAAAFPPQDVIEVHESPARRALQCEASRASEAGCLPREDREGKLPCLKAVPSAAETVAGVGWPELTSSNSMQKPSAVRWQGGKWRGSAVYTPVNEHFEAFSNVDRDRLGLFHQAAREASRALGSVKTVPRSPVVQVVSTARPQSQSH